MNQANNRSFRILLIIALFTVAAAIMALAAALVVIQVVNRGDSETPQAASGGDAGAADEGQCTEPEPALLQEATRIATEQDHPNDDLGTAPQTRLTGAKVLHSGADGVLLAARDDRALIRVFALEGGPVYSGFEVNENFPGYGPAASCVA
jgi:hypothetical protein